MAYYGVSAKPEVDVIGDSYFKRKAMEEQRQQADREFILDVAKTGISAYTGFSAVQASKNAGARDQQRLDMEQTQHEQLWGDSAPKVPYDADGNPDTPALMLSPGAAANVGSAMRTTMLLNEKNQLEYQSLQGDATINQASASGGGTVLVRMPVAEAQLYSVNQKDVGLTPAAPAPVAYNPANRRGVGQALVPPIM
jgi:hypothetical protein